MTQENKKWSHNYGPAHFKFYQKEPDEVLLSVDFLSCQNYVSNLGESLSEFEQRALQSVFDSIATMKKTFVKTAEEKSFIVKDKSDNVWFPIEELDIKENYGVPYLLFSKELIDEDFNPSGVVDGFYQEGEGWVGGVWDNDQDCYNVVPVNPTHYKEKRGPNV